MCNVRMNWGVLDATFGDIGSGRAFRAPEAYSDASICGRSDGGEEDKEGKTRKDVLGAKVRGPVAVWAVKGGWRTGKCDRPGFGDDVSGWKWKEGRSGWGGTGSVGARCRQGRCRVKFWQVGTVPKKARAGSSRYFGGKGEGTDWGVEDNG